MHDTTSSYLLQPKHLSKFHKCVVVRVPWFIASFMAIQAYMLCIMRD